MDTQPAHSETIYLIHLLIKLKTIFFIILETTFLFRVVIAYIVLILITYFLQQAHFPYQIEKRLA